MLAFTTGAANTGVAITDITIKTNAAVDLVFIVPFLSLLVNAGSINSSSILMRCKKRANYANSPILLSS